MIAVESFIDDLLSDNLWVTVYGYVNTAYIILQKDKTRNLLHIFAGRGDSETISVFYTP